MARIVGDGGSAAGSARELGTEPSTALPADQPVAPDSVEPAETREPPVFPLQRQCDSRTVAAVLRLFGVGAAALALSGAYPDGAEEPERRWDITVDVQAASAIVAPLAIKIRTAFGACGLYVEGQAIRLGHDELELMRLLLSRSGSWLPHDAVDKRIWPADKGDLGNRRKNLFWRVNQKLTHEVEAALARSGRTRLPASPRIIQSRAGHVRFNLQARMAVSRKV